MNTPVSLFEEANINVNKSTNVEEEEDLEDQKRRKEELQNLLLTKLDDFNYDESTINSSIVSAISVDDDQKKYLKADTQNEQLQVLYEVRGRELQALRDEYKNVTGKLTNEIDTVKKKLLLTEAELEQIKVSYRNSEELLIDKTECIKELTSTLETKDKEILDYVKNIENLHLELATYKSTLDDLHLKINGDRNPFNNSNKQFNSEEMREAHKEQINRLESLLDEKTSHAKQTEKENILLKGELKKVIDANTDNTKLIDTLTKNFEGAQKQCEELIEVVEMLSNENKYLQERLDSLYNNSPIKHNNSVDYNSLISHVDKLKKMLVDKSVQINTLNAKLQNYEENLKELLEYRKLKSDSYQKEFQQCDNDDHTKNLIVMQNDLQNYRRIMDDKNQQILNLNSTNKDLLAKMEETLSQTRNDIQKFSNKYSLPQLEKMAEDLKVAQTQITHLENELKISEERRLSLIHKETNKEKSLKEELKALKLLKDKERNNFDNEVNKLQKDLDIYLTEIKNLKQYFNELQTENAKLQSQINNNGVEGETLKKQYLESTQALNESEKKVKNLLEMIDELTNLKTIAEGERCNFEFEVKDAQNNMEKANNYITNLENELAFKAKDLQEKDKIILELQESVLNLKEELSKISEGIIKKDLMNSKETETEYKKNNLDSDLLTVEKLEKDKEAILLETKLREEIQRDFFNKLQEIEKNYQLASSSSKDLSKEHVVKLKTQESQFRNYISVVLKECTRKIKEFDDDRDDLIKNLNLLHNQFEEFKFQTVKREDYLKKVICDIQIKNRREAEKWKLWSKKLVNGCLKVESTNKKTRDSILYNMQKYDSDVAKIERSYQKLRKKLKSTK